MEVALNNADSAVLLAGSLSHREVMKSSIQVDGLEKVVWSIAGWMAVDHMLIRIAINAGSLWLIMNETDMDGCAYMNCNSFK